MEYGCLGLILYSDPIDYTVPWDGVYPDSWYLPSTGAQRGTVETSNGDLRTPNYPSIRKYCLRHIREHCDITCFRVHVVCLSLQ